LSDRPVVYLAHPLSGDWEANIADARLWVRAALEAGYAPVAPYLEDYSVLQEPEDRDLGIAHDLAVLERCEGLILCGPVVSPGMQLEREKARQIDIPVWHIATMSGIPAVKDFDLRATAFDRDFYRWMQDPEFAQGYAQERARIGAVDETVLQEADRLINGDRQAAYAHPLDDLTATGRMWGAILTGFLGREIPDIPAEYVALMMVGVKLSRESRHFKRDNRVDGPGYWGCEDMIIQERQRRSTEEGS